MYDKYINVYVTNRNAYVPYIYILGSSARFARTGLRRYISADVLRQIYYSRYIMVDILRQIYYDIYIYIYIYITVDILWQIYYGRYITADTLQQMYYGSYILRQIHDGKYTMA